MAVVSIRFRAPRVAKAVFSGLKRPGSEDEHLNLFIVIRKNARSSMP
jgi:hypothetical protein